MDMGRKYLDHFLESLLGSVNEFIEKEVYSDSLTRLRTTKLFCSDFDEFVKQYNSSFIALSFIEIDQFRNFNTIKGHEAGNNILRKIGQILVSKESLNHRSYRWGGDEILVISNAESIPDIEKSLQSLKEEIEKEVEKQITLSIGVSIKSHSESKSKDEMITEAESAVMLAKTELGNKILFASQKSLEMFKLRKSMFRYSFQCDNCKTTGHFNITKVRRPSDVFNCMACGHELTVW